MPGTLGRVMNILGHHIDDEIELSIVAPRDGIYLFDLIDGSRERLGKWLGFVSNTLSVSDVEAFIAEKRQAFALGQSYTFAISYLGKVAGVISIEVEKVQNAGEIGYWLGANFEGKGIVSRSVEALTQFGFEELLLRRLVINVATENQRSINVALGAGYQLEGIARSGAKVGEDYYDAKVFSRLSTDQ